MNYLKQSTAATIKLGPFVDDTDGKTAETALTIAQADVRLSKNGGDMAQKNDATSATNDELGYYDVPLNATDTGTLGRLNVMVTKSGALPVWAEYLVVTANVFDTLCSTDKFDVNAAEMGGVAQADQYVKVSSGTGTGQISLNSGAVLLQATQTGVTIPTVTNLTNAPTNGDLTATMKTSVTTAATAATPTAAAVTGAVGSVTGNVGGNVNGTVKLDATQAAYAPAKAGDAMTLTSGERTGIAAAVWNALTSGMPTVGSIGKKLADWVVGTIDTYTGNTKQTGDAYARLGEPSGADIAADIAAVALSSATSENVLSDPDFGLAAVKADTAAINAKTTNLPPDPADQSAVEAAITAATSTTGVKVASYATGLSPAEQLLIVPSRKLYTSTDGFVDLVDAPNSTAVAAFASAISSTMAARTIDGTLNQDEYGKLIAALLAGLMTVTDNGGGSYTTVWYRQDGTTPAITVDTDATGRTGVTLGTLS